MAPNPANLERNGSDTERLLHAMEEAFEHERKQREMLEKKYARLKRRYVRLERTHSRLLMESHETKNKVEMPVTQCETRDDSHEFASSSSPTPMSAVNDLSGNSNHRSLDTTFNDLLCSRLRLTTSDDICRDSLSSTLGSPDVTWSRINEEKEQEKVEEEEELLRCNTHGLYSIPTSRGLHLDFSLPARLTDSHRSISIPPRRMQLYGTHWNHSTSSHSSQQSASPMTTHSGERRMRICPRLDRHDDSSERSIAHSYGQEFEHDQLEPCVRRHWQYHWASDPPQVPLISSPVASSPVIATHAPIFPAHIPTPASHPRTLTDEEASLALARYLQQQEYISAYEEYEARFLEESPHQEYNHQIYGHTSSDFMNNQRYIDPDNMTYEELLRLGEEVGDVKKDRWRQKACEVLSSLPTHHWTPDDNEDTCIICQYTFTPNDRVMTLPCAHIFHGDFAAGASNQRASFLKMQFLFLAQKRLVLLLGNLVIDFPCLPPA
ncbi:hypothetical protein PsorP6_000168 [Peronosclerospora sorghi]|uniref:Uncharacterized protein n=1 Tax=Peronosclerospora sorghi TaxID=230839 RepID=A0ACC0WYW9_9STRA|nr:hypothetical protein PsorP6_000168 [Peronosclerospora sorghi]